MICSRLVVLVAYGVDAGDDEAADDGGSGHSQGTNTNYTTAVTHDVV